MSTAAPMQPLGDRILVKPIEASERVIGGIVIPDTAQEKPQQGIVIAVGDGVSRCTLDGTTPRIDVDDRVLYSKYAGSEITIEDVAYLVVREADCLGILPPLSAEELELEAVASGDKGTRETNNLEL